MSIAYPDACGIDLGAHSHFVAVPPDRDDEPVREFRAFTGDLRKLVHWLRRCRITAVAMESTGVYWIALYEMLDAAGFEVHRVNARHVKTVPGRKSDVLDCQWLQQLMSFGRLRGAFRPADEVCALYGATATCCSPTRRGPRAAHTKGADPNERATAPRHRRPHGRDRPGHRARHRRGRA